MIRASELLTWKESISLIGLKKKKETGKVMTDLDAT